MATADEQQSQVLIYLAAVVAAQTASVAALQTLVTYFGPAHLASTANLAWAQASLTAEAASLAANTTQLAVLTESAAW
jgi:hypothetical protein